MKLETNLIAANNGSNFNTNTSVIRHLSLPDDLEFQKFVKTASFAVMPKIDHLECTRPTKPFRCSFFDYIFAYQWRTVSLSFFAWANNRNLSYVHTSKLLYSISVNVEDPAS